jgi:hypothetical protein
MITNSNRAYFNKSRFVDFRKRVFAKLYLSTYGDLKFLFSEGRKQFFNLIFGFLFGLLPGLDD